MTGTRDKFMWCIVKSWIWNWWNNWFIIYIEDWNKTSWFKEFRHFRFGNVHFCHCLNRIGLDKFHKYFQTLATYKCLSSTPLVCHMFIRSPKLKRIALRRSYWPMYLSHLSYFQHFRFVFVCRYQLRPIKHNTLVMIIGMEQKSLTKL